MVDGSLNRTYQQETLTCNFTYIPVLLCFVRESTGSCSRQATSGDSGPDSPTVTSPGVCPPPRSSTPPRSARAPSPW